MRKYTYFPGCSLKGTGRAYEESLLAVCKALDIQMQEIDDWNCCGATAYMNMDEMKAFALTGRNLAKAEESKDDLVAPCNSCYMVLHKTQQYMRDYPDAQNVVGAALTKAGLTYKGTAKIRHPLEILSNDIGLKEIASKIKKPLKGLKVAPHYGCMIVRPYAFFDDVHNPVVMDNLLTTAGAQVVEYPLKTRCCGASETGTVPEVGQHLAYFLLKEAVRRGADVIATICPLCQFNLDGYQDKISSRFGKISIPVLYFTQLLGLALGLSEEELAIHRGIVPAGPVLAAKGIV